MPDFPTEWHPVDTAPYMKVIWVRNSLMSFPVKATRGYVVDHMVHENQNYFTSVATHYDKFSVFPSGHLVCPTEWAEI